MIDVYSWHLLFAGAIILISGAVALLIYNQWSTALP